MKFAKLILAIAASATLCSKPASAQRQDNGGPPPVYPAPPVGYPPPPPIRPSPPRFAGPPCLPSGVAQAAKVIALGTYEGRRETMFTIDNSPHDVGLVPIGANPEGPPVVLVLSAYEATVWDLRAFPKKRLRAVLAYGYYGQAVAGVPASVPVRFIRRSEVTACGRASYAYEGGRNLEQLAVAVEQATGRKIDDFQGVYSAEGFHLERGSLPEPGPLGTRDIRSDYTVTIDVVAPKQAGIRQLIDQGAIRVATPADVKWLGDALTKASPTGHLAPVRPRYLREGNTFVVLRAITVPKGMYGGHSATFLIPPHVPTPRDPGSHNTYYTLADGGCRGAGCGQ